LQVCQLLLHLLPPRVLIRHSNSLSLKTDKSAAQRIRSRLGHAAEQNLSRP
jgi:hypothetical protein